MIDSSTPPKNHLLGNIVLFGRVLRRAGITIDSSQIQDFASALEWIDLTKREDVKAAARCILVRRREDLPTFDRAFDLFWRRRSYDPAGRETVRALGKSLQKPQTKREPTFFTIAITPLSADEEIPAHIQTIQTYSAQELLRHKDFGTFTREEIEEAKRLMRAMPWRIGERESRRRTRGGNEFLDLRATMRQNLRHGGELMRLKHRQPVWKPRPLVVLCDISGSMENYSRLFLQFIHALRGGYQNVESFVFSTRLTRITRQLRSRDIDIALREVSRVVVDWSGGTRIGEALKNFNFVWARRVLRPGAVGLIISDGWDRGEPELLRREIARLRRNVFRLIWLNPLLASRDYEPLTQGLQAALPFVDDFLPAHNLASLEDLAQRLSALDYARPRSQVRGSRTNR